MLTEEIYKEMKECLAENIDGHGDVRMERVVFEHENPHLAPKRNAQENYNQNVSDALEQYKRETGENYMGDVQWQI